MSRLTDEIRQKLKDHSSQSGPSWLEIKFESVLKSYMVSYTKEMPIGPYFADFALPDQKIIIEVDGYEFHKDRSSYDAQRDRWIQSKGWKVIRLTYEDVMRTDIVFDILKTNILGINPKKRLYDESVFDPILHSPCKFCSELHLVNTCELKEDFEINDI